MASVQDLKDKLKHRESQLEQSRKRVAELERWKEEAERTLEDLGRELLVYTKAKIDKAQAEVDRLQKRTIIKPGDPDFALNVVKRIGGRR